MGVLFIDSIKTLLMVKTSDEITGKVGNETRQVRIRPGHPAPPPSLNLRKI
jgi:hypothetical protein